MAHLLVGISQLVTPKQIIEQAAIFFDERILWIGKESDFSGQSNVIDIANKAVIPGLIDSHTHLIWAGDRLNDFEAKFGSYEQILASGGGIRQTIRQTAAATVEELVKLAKPRLNALLYSGATAIEIKSGYGFSLEAELRSLEAIKILRNETNGTIVPTLLIHIPPSENRESYITMVCNELIPMVSARKLADIVDVFVEKEAFTIDEAREILLTAKEYGLKTKLHVDQFHTIGGVELAIELEALSVDHLEVSGTKQIESLAKSNTVATILPGVSLHLGIPSAPGRQLIDAGATVAIGTDSNPGSSPLFSMQLALALAVRLNGLTPFEALTAATLNGAKALGLNDRGSIEVGKKADFLVLKTSDWREITYRLGDNLVEQIWINGKRI